MAKTKAPELNRVIRHIRSRCGGGKSVKTIEAVHTLVHNGLDADVVLFASKTHNLTKQNRTELDKLNQIYNTDIESISINSKEHNVGSEINNILKDGFVGVVFITHAALALIDHENLDDVIIFCDEVPTNLCGILSVRYDVTNGMAQWESEYFEPVESQFKGYMRVALKAGVNPDEVLALAKRIYDGVDNRYSHEVAHLLEHVVDGHEVTYTTITDNENRQLRVYQSTFWSQLNNVFTHAKHVFILSAQLEQSLLGFIATQRLGFTIRDEPLNKELEQKHKNKVTIYPILSKGNWSRTLMDQPACNVLIKGGLELVHTGTVLDYAQQIAKSIIADRTAVLTLNVDDEIHSDLVEQVSRTTSAVHGLNHLRELDHAIYLASTRPTPFDLKALRMFAMTNGLDEEYLTQAFLTERCYEAAYQCVARTSIRMPYDQVQDREHIIVVPDMEYAKYISTWFEDGCITIDMSHSLTKKPSTRMDDAAQQRKNIIFALMSDKKNKVGKVKDLIVKYGVSMPTYKRYVKEFKEDLVEAGLK